jgi:AcrR family transcriptional regulator
MTETTIGLRERKKARTRQVIADAAARLFAERGYERVSVAEVARAAEVSEQTVYNYFQTKEALVTDLDEPLQAELCRLIRERDPGSTPAAAIRAVALDSVDGIARVPVDQWRGELGYLAAISPTVQRLALEMSARQADALAGAIGDTGDMSPELAQLQAIALVGVFQIIVREAGQRTVDGQDQQQIATELRPAIDAILAELDRWFSRDAEPAG